MVNVLSSRVAGVPQVTHGSRAGGQPPRRGDDPGDQHREPRVLGANPAIGAVQGEVDEQDGAEGGEVDDSDDPRQRQQPEQQPEEQAGAARAQPVGVQVGSENACTAGGCGQGKRQHDGVGQHAREHGHGRRGGPATRRRQGAQQRAEAEQQREQQGELHQDQGRGVPVEGVQGCGEVGHQRAVLREQPPALDHTELAVDQRLPEGVALAGIEVVVDVGRPVVQTQGIGGAEGRDSQAPRSEGPAGEHTTA